MRAAEIARPVVTAREERGGALSEGRRRDARRGTGTGKSAEVRGRGRTCTALG